MCDPITIGLIGSAVIGAGTSIFGAVTAKGAAEKAAGAQITGAEKSTQAQLEMFYKAREDTAPWRDIGEDALTQLRTTLGLPPAATQAAPGTPGYSSGNPTQDFMNRTPGAWDAFRTAKASNPNWTVDQWAQEHFQNTTGQPGVYWGTTQQPTNVLADPGATDQGVQGAAGPAGGFPPGTSPDEFIKSPAYNWLLEQGVEGQARFASATGGTDSGAALKRVEGFAQGLASTEYDNFLTNWLRTQVNPQLALAGMGQVSAGQTSAQGVATGANIGQNYLAAGQAAAGGFINRANAITGGATGIANVASQGVNNYLFYDFLQKQQASKVPYTG